MLVDSLPGRTVGADRPDMARGRVSAAAFNGMSELPEAIARTVPLTAVVVQLGANDLLVDKALAPEALVARLVDMAGLITGYRFPVPLAGMAVPLRALILSPPAFSAQPGNPLWQADEARRARLPALLRAAGADHGFAVADAAEAVPVPGADGLHFGAEAHARLGALVARALRTLLGEPPRRVGR
jgi:lysophospholipase L1-like esterase